MRLMGDQQLIAGALAELPEPLQRFGGLSATLASLLEQVDSHLARYHDLRLAGRILPNTLEALRIELTYHSNAIEGSTLTLRETQLVIEGKSPAGEKPLREIYEARNHDRALRLIESWASGRPQDVLREQDILDVHAQVLADIDPASAGRFRSQRMLIAGTGFVPPGAQKIEGLVARMIELANAPGVHPVLAAAELHYNLVANHPFDRLRAGPFIDGNGRTARLMMNQHLLRHQFPFALIEINERGKYLGALDKANQGRIEPFAAFIAQSVIRSIERLLIE